MKSLKGTKTHDNLKAAFAGESQANRRYLYFANKADVEGPERRRGRCSGRRPKARPAMRTAISTTSRRSATRPRICRSAPRART